MSNAVAMNLLLEPFLWIALVAWAAFSYWAITYIRAANRVAQWIDANDCGFWVRMIWTNMGRQFARYDNRIARRLEALILVGGGPNLPSDIEFRTRLSDARWAAFFCLFFWTLAIIAIGLLFHVMKI